MFYWTFSDPESCISRSNKIYDFGIIRDSITGEEIIGASMIIESSRTGVDCNEYGFCSLTFPEDTYTIVYSSLGHKASVRHIILMENRKLNVSLSGETQRLVEVKISDSTGIETLACKVDALNLFTAGIVSFIMIALMAFF